MSQRLLTCQSVSRIQLEQADHQQQSFLRQRSHVALLKSFGLGDLRELEADEPWILIEAFHLLFRERAQHFLNQIKLIHLTVAREQGLAVRQLTHNATDGPHI